MWFSSQHFGIQTSCQTMGQLLRNGTPFAYIVYPTCTQHLFGHAPPVVSAFNGRYLLSSMQTARTAACQVLIQKLLVLQNSRKIYNKGSKKPADWTWFKRDPDSPYKVKPSYVYPLSPYFTTAHPSSTACDKSSTAEICSLSAQHSMAQHGIT